MMFDRLHHCILVNFVLYKSPLPRTWIGKTVDDVSTVCPPRAVNQAKKFVKAYRDTLDTLGIGAAPEDPARLKAFDSNTFGEILGVWFNTVTMTWQLSPRKLNSLVNLLVTASKPSSCLSLHDVEVLHGKLVHIAQLAPPLSLFMAEILVFLRALLEGHVMKGYKSRSTPVFPVPPNLDLLTVTAIIFHTNHSPLPILSSETKPSMFTVPTYTDVSGHILGNPSLGVYIPSLLTEGPIVASLALPQSFLTLTDEEGHKVYCKTTMLEALGFLVAPCLDPMRFAEREALVLFDNIATVLALDRGYSQGPLGHHPHQGSQSCGRRYWVHPVLQVGEKEVLPGGHCGR